MTIHPFRLINSNNRRTLLYCTILLLGIFARVWEFGTLPPGLNQDEASIGYEAFSLLHFGMDRNGFSFPVQLVSWGSGQNVLYAYLDMPFVALGLTPITTRLPMLILGLATLPMLYYATLITLGRRCALISTFLLAISPWHIMLSRWGLESNIAPFFFLTGFTFMVRSFRYAKSFLIACTFLALCLYCYGSAYVTVPLFLFTTTCLVLAVRQLTLKTTLQGLGVFAIMAAPIMAYVLVNSLGLQTINLGFLSIPRLPVEARYQSMAAIFSNNPFQAMADNLSILLKLLFEQSDGLIWNTIETYGYFYKYTFPLAIAGAILLVPFRNWDRALEKLFLLSWLVSSFTIGILESVNVNRINLIFIPLLICIAYLLTELGRRFPSVSVIVVCLFLAGFLSFTWDYHSTNYRHQADEAFFTGLLPALSFARQINDNPICVTNTVNMPYIFVLFVEQSDPPSYRSTIEYDNPQAPFRNRTLGRYTFGLDFCKTDPETVYVLSTQEQPPENGIDYQVEPFDNYIVYSP